MVSGSGRFRGNGEGQFPSIQLVHKPLPPQTGIGRYAAELERGLRNTGVNPRVAELRLPVPSAIVRLAKQGGYDLEAFTRSYPLRTTVASGGVIHLTSQTLATLCFTQRLPRPVVITVHDILPYLLRDDPQLRFYRGRIEQAVDALAMRGLRRADRLIANSQYTKQTLVEQLGVSLDRIDVVYLGVDAERFRPQPVPAQFRERYGLPPDRRIVLYVGSEDPRKDLATLLAALPLVRREAEDIVLLKVGAPAFPEQRQRHLRLCENLGIAGIVRWLDEVPEEDLPLFYNAASVFAFPSLYEGFGFPVLEALSCGTPVVARRTSSLPELGGDVATLLDDADPAAMAAAILAVLAGRGLPPEMLVAQARQFTWQRTVEATLAIYDRILPARNDAA